MKGLKKQSFKESLNVSHRIAVHHVYLLEKEVAYSLYSIIE